MNRWIDIQPGDVGFDGGIGISGWIIRTGTQSAHGHCWVYHSKNDDGSWLTVEAGPKEGLIYRTRTIEPNKVVRAWRTPQEQQAILDKSESLVGCKYGWGEIARIVARIIGIRIPKRKDNPNRVICSNHAAQAIHAGRPDYVFDYADNEIWPGELSLELGRLQWIETRTKEKNDVK